MLRFLFVSMLLVWQALVIAAPGSYSGNIESGDGGGPLPGASIVFGIIGAIAGVFASFQDNGGLTDMAQLAFWGFCIGSVIGLPVAWLLS